MSPSTSDSPARWTPSTWSTAFLTSSNTSSKPSAEASFFSFSRDWISYMFQRYQSRRSRISYSPGSGGRAPAAGAEGGPAELGAAILARVPVLRGRGVEVLDRAPAKEDRQLEHDDYGYEEYDVQDGPAVRGDHRGRYVDDH